MFREGNMGNDFLLPYGNMFDGVNSLTPGKRVYSFWSVICNIIVTGSSRSLLSVNIQKNREQEVRKQKQKNKKMLIGKWLRNQLILDFR